MNWLVYVQGHSKDLDQLQDALSTSTPAITRDKAGYLITSSEFQELSTGDEVRQAAISHLKIVNGACRLVLGSPSRIEIKSIYRVEDNGNLVAQIFPDPIVLEQVLSSPTTAYTNSAGVTVVAKPADPIKQILSVASKNENVSKVLRLIDTGDDGWVNLYRIFELVRADVEEKGMLAWVSSRQITRFTRTSNHPGAAGDEARHGHLPDQPPPRPMSPHEAKVFVFSIVHAWLDSLPDS